MAVRMLLHTFLGSNFQLLDMHRCEILLLKLSTRALSRLAERLVVLSLMYAYDVPSDLRIREECRICRCCWSSRTFGSRIEHVTHYRDARTSIPESATLTAGVVIVIDPPPPRIHLRSSHLSFHYGHSFLAQQEQLRSLQPARSPMAVC